MYTKYKTKPTECVVGGSIYCERSPFVQLFIICFGDFTLLDIKISQADALFAAFNQIR